MGLNGHRFKPHPWSKPCPACHGYPPLKLTNNRLVPQCDTCGGGGTVPNRMEPARERGELP